MLATQRHQNILNILDERGTMRTIDLAEEFDVTHETIRRDLLSLADSGLLTRIHGGACSLIGRPKLRTFTERSLYNTEEKKAIAKAAVDLIEPGKTYAFDSSTTVIALVDILPDLPYRVISNAHAVSERLLATEKVELFSMGGRYHRETRTFVSHHSIETLRRYHIDTTFVSCIGFDLIHGASEGYEEQASYKETLVEHSENVVLLIDSTKFNERSDYYFAPVNRTNCIITDSNIDPKVAQSIRESGIALTIAECS